MAGRLGVVIVGSSIVALSCTRAPATPSPAPGTGTTARPAAQTQPGAPGGIVTLPPRRVPPSRDSLVKLRATYIAQVMHDIAGREKEPAEQVFKNVQVLKGITAGELVQKMDKEYSVGLSWNCSNWSTSSTPSSCPSSIRKTRRRSPARLAIAVTTSRRRRSI